MGMRVELNVSLVTQVALNGDGDYEGGRLVYLTGNGVFRTPPRPAGTTTIHNCGIVHGVTKMGWGVRYGLFLLLRPSLLVQ